MSLITPFPEAESPALERFALVGSEAVAALLHELRDRRTLITLYYEDESGFSVGNIFDVDSARETVMLECAVDAVPQLMAHARGLVAVGFLDSSKIQFELVSVETVDHNGRLAVRAPLPSRALRIQRRSAPRRSPPGGRPVLCHVPRGPAAATSREALRVLDIGIGGLAFLATPTLPELVRDQVLERCYLDLPEIGQIAVTLKVRYLDAWPLERGGRRCGCEFVDLAGGARRSLQAYLDRLEVAQSSDDGRRVA